MVFLLAFVALMGIHAGALFDPPYWDGLVGAFSQGLWFANHDFDVVRLITAEKTCPDGGPNVYPFSLYPLAIGALYASGLEPRFVFLVVHLAVLASAASAIVACLAISRAATSATNAVLVTMVLATLPMFHALSAQMNMDMPLLAFTLASMRAMQRGAPGRACLLAAGALLVLPRGVILVGANTVALLALARARSRLENAPALTRGELLRGFAGHAALLLVFAAQVLVSSLYSSGPAFVSWFEGFRDLALRISRLVPDLVLVLGLALACSVAVAARLRSGRASWTGVLLAAFVVVFAAFFGQYTNTLPRYLLQSQLPAVLLVLLVVDSLPFVRRLVVPLLVATCVFQVANHTGELYPRVPSGWHVPGYAEAGGPSNDGHVLERSMAYRDDLELNRRVAAELEAYDRARTLVVAPWPLTHALAFPELGYVERAWRTSSPSVPITFDPNAVPLADLYDFRRSPPMQRYPGDVVWVLVPSVYMPARLALQTSIDAVERVVERGAHRAFVVRRTGWSVR